MAGDGFGEVTERLRRFTVQVRASRGGSGSGIVWRADGLVVTNAHVLREGAAQVEFWNGRRTAARVLKSDRRRDLVFLQVEGGGLPFAVPGDSDALRPGELVIAVGNPFGFSGAVSTGVIHSVGALGGRPWVASNVRLAPGNSGGPLANARGDVVGVNTMIAGGLALAIPSKSVAQFLATTEKSPARLGVTLRAVPLERGSGRLGLVVLEVGEQSAAERASLLPGDVLVGAAGKRFRSLEDLEDALHSLGGGSLEIEFRRGGSERTRKVVVQVRPEVMAA
jgi:serine protease Do